MAIIEVHKASMKFHHGQRRLLRELFTRRATPDFYALTDVSFKVESGESIAIMGRNGAGKSTLLSLLSGLTPPSRGTVQVRGKVAALLELGSGFHPDLSGRENVLLNAALLGFKEGPARALIPEIVAFAELDDFIDEPLRTYSAGMILRLAFAVAVHSEPAIVLIDEVLSVGDAAFQTKCHSRILQMKREGRTLIVVSHVSDQLSAICDRGLLLDRGRLLMDGPIVDVIEAYLIKEDAQPEG